MIHRKLTTIHYIHTSFIVILSCYINIIVYLYCVVSIVVIWSPYSSTILSINVTDKPFLAALSNITSNILTNTNTNRNLLLKDIIGTSPLREVLLRSTVLLVMCNLSIVTTFGPLHCGLYSRKVHGLFT